MALGMAFVVVWGVKRPGVIKGLLEKVFDRLVTHDGQERNDRKAHQRRHQNLPVSSGVGGWRVAGGGLRVLGWRLGWVENVVPCRTRTSVTNGWNPSYLGSVRFLGIACGFSRLGLRVSGAWDHTAYLGARLRQNFCD